MLIGDLSQAGLENGQEIELDLETGSIAWEGGKAQAEPFSAVQMEIYQRGGLLAR